MVIGKLLRERIRAVTVIAEACRMLVGHCVSGFAKNTAELVELSAR